MAHRGKRLWRNMQPSEYGALLGRRCMVDFHGQRRECTVVAVSWKGALGVREDGRKTRWVPKEQVPDRVRLI